MLSMTSTEAWLLAVFVVINVAAGFAAARIPRNRSAWWVLVVAIPALAVYVFFTFQVLDSWLYGAPVPVVGMVAASIGRWAENRASRRPVQSVPLPAS